MPRHKESEHFLLRLKPLMLIPIGNIRQFICLRRSRRMIVENPEEPSPQDRAASSARAQSPCPPRPSAHRRPNESSAPALISDSTTRLFISRRSTFRKTPRTKRRPFLLRQFIPSRENRINCITPDVLDRRQSKPNRLAVRKSASLNRTSGGSTGISISRHSLMYLTTFSGFEISESTAPP